MSYIFYKKKTIKNILKVSKFHPSKKLFVNGFKSLNFIKKEQLLILIYKITNNLIKHNFNLVHVGSLHEYQTRRRSHHNIDFFQSDIRCQNILYKGLSDFNELPRHIKNESTISKFKTSLRQHPDSLNL